MAHVVAVRWTPGMDLKSFDVEGVSCATDKIFYKCYITVKIIFI